MYSLTYAYDALEPILSSKTVKEHYNLYKKYFDNLNRLVVNPQPLELIKQINVFPLKDRDEILFNLGGVLNHELYFDIMGPNNHELTGQFKNKVISQYGSFDNFKKEFVKVAKELIGSGYTFVVLNDNNLEIINMANQDTPYYYGLEPIMNIDLWEHAYYLDYSNRNEYINNFFSIVDFDKVNKYYEKALQKNI